MAIYIEYNLRNGHKMDAAYWNSMQMQLGDGRTINSIAIE